MTDKLVKSIYEVAKNFKDPVTNNRLDQDNNNINIVCKNSYFYQIDILGH